MSLSSPSGDISIKLWTIEIHVLTSWIPASKNFVFKYLGQKYPQIPLLHVYTPIIFFAVQNQLGRNCPALELLSLGENPLTSISEYSGGLQKLFSLNLNITRIPDWSDLDKLREYPSLTELRIKHCPVLEEYTAHERRMMLVARLPNIQVIENELSNLVKNIHLLSKNYLLDSQWW